VAAAPAALCKAHASARQLSAAEACGVAPRQAGCPIKRSKADLGACIQRGAPHVAAAGAGPDASLQPVTRRAADGLRGWKGGRGLLGWAHCHARRAPQQQRMPGLALLSASPPPPSSFLTDPSPPRPPSPCLHRCVALPFKEDCGRPRKAAVRAARRRPGVGPVAALEEAQQLHQSARGAGVEDWGGGGCVGGVAVGTLACSVFWLGGLRSCEGGLRAAKKHNVGFGGVGWPGGRPALGVVGREGNGQRHMAPPRVGHAFTGSAAAGGRADHGAANTTAEAAGAHEAAQVGQGGEAGAAPVPSGRTASARVTPGSTSTLGRRPRSRQSMRTAKSMAPCSVGGAAGGWVLLIFAHSTSHTGCCEAAVKGRELRMTKPGRRAAAAAGAAAEAARERRRRIPGKQGQRWRGEGSSCGGLTMSSSWRTRSARTMASAAGMPAAAGGGQPSAKTGP
jgi:hypothetical protein